MALYKFKIALLALLLIAVTGVAQVEDYGDDRKRPVRPDAPEGDNFSYDSENDGKKWDWSKARIGGNFGLAFYSGGLMLDASPTFGYKVHPRVEVGAGMKIFYYKDNDVPLVDNLGYIYDYVPYKDLIYGPIGYGRFTVWEGIFIMGQYEMANKEPYYLDNPNDRINVHHLLLGGGYAASVGQAGQVNISLLYNVLDNEESIYQFGTFGNFPLLLNVSFGFGFNRRR